MISIKFVLQLPKNEFKIYQLAHFYFPFFYLGQQLYSDEAGARLLLAAGDWHGSGGLRGSGADLGVAESR